MIYDVSVNEDFNVKVIMTLTSPNCPVDETIHSEVEDNMKRKEGIEEEKDE